MLLHSTEMHIQLVKVLQEGAKGCALGHLGRSIDFVFTALARYNEQVLSTPALCSVDILGETLATISELTILTRYVGGKGTIRQLCPSTLAI